MDNEKYLDMKAMVEFIQLGLESHEIAMTADLIELILDLEGEYMIENGFAYVEEDGNDN